MRLASLALLAVSLAAAAAPASASAAVHRHPCLDAPAGTRCGSISVPLDRTGAVRGRLRIEFERYRRRDLKAPPAGTLLAIEGGPGYSTTDSRDSYLTLLAPLRARRDLLLVDLRGTGLSGALDCPALRRTVKDYVRRAGRCARELGARRDLYGTHAAVDDVAAVLDALRIGRVDLYGDSYGTFAAQAFAVHHGDRLRSLVLDGAYPVTGTDPAFSDLAEATERALRLVCARRPACAARGQDPIAVVARLVERLRARPVTGFGLGADGNRVRVRLDEPSVAALIQSGYANVPMYRDLLAAIPAFEAGDRAPLLRLFAENRLDTATSPVRGFSEGLYLAVTCHDYPQLWDPAAPLAARRDQLARTVAALPPERFAPIAPVVWTGLDYEGAIACLNWPGPRRPDPPVPPGATYPAVPTLVLNGDLDNITASSGARVVASRFPRATFVETANTVHISALGDRDGCAAPMVRRFIRRLDAGDTSCAGRVAEVRTVDRFPRTAAQSAPADPRAGDRSQPAARRVAAVATATVADAIQRWVLNSSGAGRGLRGGRWSYSGERVVRFRFRRARFARDVAVSGTATWRLSDGAVRASLRLPGRGRLRAHWSTRRQLAVATLDGTLGGRRLRATMLAP
jgi:pimeloyl-ACP methyl ester carboxylesterase